MELISDVSRKINNFEEEILEDGARIKTVVCRGMVRKIMYVEQYKKRMDENFG